MKNISSPFTKLVAVAACLLTLGSCNRAEYAMLPKGASYHGVTRVATPVPPAPAPAVTPAPADPVAAPAPAVASKVEKEPATAVATAPAASAQSATSTAAASAPASKPANTSARKPNLLQRLALNKVTRKMDKLVRKAEVRQHDNTASTTKSSISGNLRTGLILLLIGILVGLIPKLGLLGTIIFIIGIVFIVLWLLDQL
ncbi:MAG TPA: hypothetical protein VF690_14850 [Hymenobacter sp.]